MATEIIINQITPPKINVEVGQVNLIGEKGDTGQKGEKGDVGPKGDTGLAATINVGIVQTGNAGTDAYIDNVGTPDNAILNFIIPRGEKGEKGDRGDDGTNGIDGTNGLDGADGRDGTNGTNGADGISIEIIQANSEAVAISLSAANPNNIYYVV